jgi:hypothetical protein
VRVTATLVCLGVLAWGVPVWAVSPHHAGDDTEVFTGTEEVPGGGASRTPALTYWRVRAALTVGAFTKPARVGLLLPLSDGRQDILMRHAVAPGWRFEEMQAGPNLRAQWSATPPPAGELVYDLGVRISERHEVIPSLPLAEVPPPPAGAEMLAPGEDIQSREAAVVERARSIVGTAHRYDEIVWSVFQYTAAFLPPTDPPGPQDALTVLAARRGNSLGRARALVALLRAVGVHARLVGGLKLENAAQKRATSSWVEAWTGTAWAPLDPVGNHFGSLPDTYLALYRDDLPLITHTAGLPLTYGFTIRQTTRRGVEQGTHDEASTEADAATDSAAGRDGVQTHAAYVAAPVASVVIIADQSVPAAATDRILGEARAASIDCVLLTARFDSRYFRERYLERLVATNTPLIKRANLVLVATADSAGALALLGLAERGVRLPDSRVIVAGDMSQPAAVMLGSLLYTLLRPGEVALVRNEADILPLWEMARANLIDGAPLAEEAQRWSIDTIVLGEAGLRLPRWRRPLLHAWARIVKAGVPLPALTLILILPVIATIVVVARVVIGVQTFGMFGPVIVSLAFITTGLWWGTLTFVVIVGLGVLLRSGLQHLRLQAMARLAILIALVSAVMAGLTYLGAIMGIGPLLHLSVFPMLIMSNVIESFAASQGEMGTRQAVRMTVNTLVLSIACYLIVDRAGLQSLVLAYPELLLGTVVLNVLVGKWRGVRLLEYRRFLRAHQAAAARGEARRVAPE